MDTNYLQEAFVDPVGHINESYPRPQNRYNEYNDYGLASPPRSPMETERKLQKIVTPYAAHPPPAEYMTSAPATATIDSGKKFNITNVESLLVIMFIIVFITIILTSSITAIICFGIFSLNKNAAQASV